MGDNVYDKYQSFVCIPIVSYIHTISISWMVFHDFSGLVLVALMHVHRLTESKNRERVKKNHADPYASMWGVAFSTYQHIQSVAILFCFQ